MAKSNDELYRELTPYAVIDEESLTPDRRRVVVSRHYSLQDAEAKIEELSRVDPDKVKRGGFGIDGGQDG